MLGVRQLSESATIPARGSALAAGYDLSSAEDTTVPAGGRKLVKTDIAIAVPLGTYGRYTSTTRRHCSPSSLHPPSPAYSLLTHNSS